MGTEREARTVGLDALVGRANSLHKALADCHPKLSRGQVWCHRCGREQRVDSAKCFASGWPMCCGETMSIDSPDERRALTPNAN